MNLRPNSSGPRTTTIEANAIFININFCVFHFFFVLGFQTFFYYFGLACFISKKYLLYKCVTQNKIKIYKK